MPHRAARGTSAFLCEMPSRLPGSGFVPRRERRALSAKAQIIAADRGRLVDPRGRRRNLLPATKSLHAFELVLGSIYVAQKLIFVAG
jgi:hypothetical protein